MNPLAAAASATASSASSAAAAPAAAASAPAAASGASFASNFGSVHLPGFESRNPNVPTIKFLASLVKGALLALSLGLGPGQMLLLGLTAATAGAGKSSGQLAHSKPASPLTSGGSSRTLGSKMPSSRARIASRTQRGQNGAPGTLSVSGETPPSKKRFPM